MKKLLLISAAALLLPVTAVFAQDSNFVDTNTEYVYKKPAEPAPKPVVSHPVVYTNVKDAPKPREGYAYDGTALSKDKNNFVEVKISGSVYVNDKKQGSSNVRASVTEDQAGKLGLVLGGKKTSEASKTSETSETSKASKTSETSKASGTVKTLPNTAKK